MFSGKDSRKKWKNFYFILNGSNRELCFFENEKVLFFVIPCHMIVAGYYGIMLAVRVSVRLSSVHPSVHIFFSG